MNRLRLAAYVRKAVVSPAGMTGIMGTEVGGPASDPHAAHATTDSALAKRRTRSTAVSPPDGLRDSIEQCRRARPGDARASGRRRVPRLAARAPRGFRRVPDDPVRADRGYRG